MKKTSLIKNTIFLMVIQCVLLCAVFFLYLFLSYHTTREDLKDNIEDLMKVYGKELESKVENADSLLERLIYKNDDYDLLQSEEERERYFASIRIKDFLEEQITYDPYVDAVVIAEGKYGTRLDQENIDLSLKNKEALREFVSKKTNSERMPAAWTIGKIGTKDYVYKVLVWQKKAVGIFITVDDFMGNISNAELENFMILLTDKQNVVWGISGAASGLIAKGEKWEQEHTKQVQTTEQVFADENLRMVVCAKNTDFVGQVKWTMILMLMVLFVLICFSILVISYLRKEILIPMSHMKKSMEEMREGEYSLRIQENYGNQEFTVLKDTFNHLMDEIVGLKIQSYEKQINLQETELRCVRLQIRPHFFLNAMTTISSLSQQGKNREVQQYIGALSKNIRYMFRSGLHTVTLREEMKHVENYFEMQELKYPNCVFYFFDIPEAVKEWKIPQMIIHTIIENEYKYAVSVDHMLTILIKASVTEYQGEEMLLLEIEDDGKGYQMDVLNEFEKGSMKRTQNGERVGLLSVKRMLDLMYEREALFHISNIQPHGCKNTFYIPKNAVQEILQNK